MGTKEDNLQIYKNLWLEFDNILEQKGLNLSSFAKLWEASHVEDESADYKKFYGKLKKQKERREGLKLVFTSTLEQLHNYMEFLDEKRVIFKVLDDEKFGNLF